MEENVRITLFGQEKIISKESISNLQPLMGEDNFRLIRLPLWMGTFKPKMKVLHSCLYYALAVQRQLEQSKSMEFREKCLSNISDYYICQKMNFQLYEYGYLCSKILTITLEKAMHLIYYLVYARLASKPYISSLIVENGKKNRHFKKKATMKSEKQYSIQSKSHDSRHLTIFCDVNASQTEHLKKQLKRIMNPQAVESKKMTRKLENKRYFNIRKLYPNDSEFKEENECQKVEEYRSTATSRVANIPTKVCNRENSSIISRLKFKSGIGSADNLFKKVHVRRQKFNEKFESTEKYMKMLKEQDCKQNKKPENATSKHVIEKDLKGSMTPYNRNQKNAFEYFQGIASSIRSKNQQFDFIRYSCINHNDRNMSSSKQSLFNYERESILSKHTLKTDCGTIIDTPDCYIKMQSHRQSAKDENNKPQYTFALSQKEKQSTKMNKTASVGKFTQPPLRDYLVGNIIRKNDNMAVEDDQIVLFNRKLKNKFKLQRYKQEYNQFLKTQLFQKSKDNV